MTRPAHAGVTFALAISLAACTVPDPRPELAATQQALDAIEQHALPGLRPLAQEERRSAMAARIATNEAVYSLGPDVSWSRAAIRREFTTAICARSIPCWRGRSTQLKWSRPIGYCAIIRPP